MIVLGNGESRKAIQIKCPNIGCNAAHRDYVLDHLICVDQRCLKEAIKGPNTENTLLYTRPDWIRNFKDPRVRLVPTLPYTGSLRQDDPWHWGSGPFSILLAATLSDEIKMLGFDLFSKTKYVNNVYKGTANYSNEDYRAVDPSYWVYQISQCFKHYPDKYFIVYNDSEWQMPDSWKLANVSFKTLDEFQE